MLEPTVSRGYRECSLWFVCSQTGNHRSYSGQMSSSGRVSPCKWATAECWQWWRWRRSIQHLLKRHHLPENWKYLSKRLTTSSIPQSTGLHRPIPPSLKLRRLEETFSSITSTLIQFILLNSDIIQRGQPPHHFLGFVDCKDMCISIQYGDRFWPSTLSFFLWHFCSQINSTPILRLYSRLLILWQVNRRRLQHRYVTYMPGWRGPSQT